MYDKEKGLYVAHSGETPISFTGKMVNRHGLIAGATGTGKTVTLQVLAETFSQAGVPCFMADMKGDLSGIALPGKSSAFIEKRIKEFGIPLPEFKSCPVRFYDVFGEQGHPIRATISQLGPQLLSRLLGLNETQDGVLNIVFRIADDRKLLLIDIKDLRALLDWISKHAKDYASTYGNISAASVGAIQRAILQLENQGANSFFGEPSFDIQDLLQTEDGKGVLNVLAADRLMMNPKLYSTFLLWLLSELYSTLPEVGDLELPKLVFFFDEAHMLFDGTSKALLDKIEQVVRLIRSKGVGVYFISQSPLDIPENILGQLGNRVQHALRAFTPKDQKAVKAAADTFRSNPAFRTDEAIMSLETGEALVSFLDSKGAPMVVERARILFPLSQIGAVTPEQRSEIIRKSRIYGKYDTPIDRISAFEVLMEESESNLKAEEEKQKKEASSAKKEPKKQKSALAKIGKSVITAVVGVLSSILASFISNKITGKETKSRTSNTDKIVKSAVNAATKTATKEFSRGMLGNLLK